MLFLHFCINCYIRYNCVVCYFGNNWPLEIGKDIKVLKNNFIVIIIMIKITQEPENGLGLGQCGFCKRKERGLRSKEY